MIGVQAFLGPGIVSENRQAFSGTLAENEDDQRQLLFSIPLLIFQRQHDV